jgi:hypothetical protein
MNVWRDTAFMSWHFISPKPPSLEFPLNADTGTRLGWHKDTEQRALFDEIICCPLWSFRLRHKWRNGATHVLFEPLDLIAKLAALVPPPRFNLVRYNGIFGPASRWRSQIVTFDSGETGCVHRPPRVNRGSGKRAGTRRATES